MHFCFLGRLCFPPHRVATMRQLLQALAYAPDDKLIIENLRKHEMGQL